jgi:hypothetical protein
MTPAKTTLADDQWQVAFKPVTLYKTGARIALPPSYTDEYAWRCDSCGWLGTGHFSPSACREEAIAHKCPDTSHSDGGPDA